MPEPADPRVNLARNRTTFASFRTQLALDRTTLAWIRTALSLAGFGFGMVGFFRSLREKTTSPETIRLHEGAIQMGVALLVLGIVATVLAAGSHWFTLRRLQRGDPLRLAKWPLSITVAIMLAIIGLTGLWHIFR